MTEYGKRPFCKVDENEIHQRGMNKQVLHIGTIFFLLLFKISETSN